MLREGAARLGVGGKDAGPPPSTYDPGALNRAIIRRFEPVKREAVAATLAKQTPPGTTVAESHRWALTGEGVDAGEALGKKAAAAPTNTN